MQTKGSKRFRGIRGSTFSVDVEYSKDYIILHLPEVTTFNKTTFIEMVYLLEDIWELFRTFGYEALYTAVDPNNSKINRLLRKLNFKAIGYADSMRVWSYTGG